MLKKSLIDYKSTKEHTALLGRRDVSGAADSSIFGKQLFKEYLTDGADYVGQTYPDEVSEETVDQIVKDRADEFYKMFLLGLDRSLLEELIKEPSEGEWMYQLTGDVDDSSNSTARKDDDIGADILERINYAKMFQQELMTELKKLFGESNEQKIFDALRSSTGELYKVCKESGISFGELDTATKEAIDKCGKSVGSEEDIKKIKDSAKTQISEKIKSFANELAGNLGNVSESPKQEEVEKSSREKFMEGFIKNLKAQGVEIPFPNVVPPEAQPPPPPPPPPPSSDGIVKRAEALRASSAGASRTSTTIVSELQAKSADVQGDPLQFTSASLVAKGRMRPKTALSSRHLSGYEQRSKDSGPVSPSEIDPAVSPVNSSVSSEGGSLGPSSPLDDGPLHSYGLKDVGRLEDQVEPFAINGNDSAAQLSDFEDDFNDPETTHEKPKNSPTRP